MHHTSNRVMIDSDSEFLGTNPSQRGLPVMFDRYGARIQNYHLPKTDAIASPYDPEARYSTKCNSAWLGYKAHVTETCDPEHPDLITNVETIPVTTPDDHMAAVIHAVLAARDLLPQEHLVDKGYTDVDVLIRSQQEYGMVILKGRHMIDKRKPPICHSFC